MTTNQLKYFITVAECLNFTEAGKKHFISQTAITQHIRALEDQLNTKLFIRDKRHVELTPAGEVFLIEARGILERMQIAIQKTEKAANGITGTLNIGYVKGYENTNIGDIIKDYHDQYPNIYFQLYRRSHLDLMLLLDQKKIDLAINICYGDTDNANFVHQKITSIPLYAVMYPTHPYAQLSSIRRYDLRNESFLLTRFYDESLAKNYYIPEQFASAGFIPKVVGTSSDIETLLLLVSSGIGISIMPASAIRYVKQSNNLVFIPLEGDHEYIDIVAFWKHANDNPAISTFMELLSANPWTVS
jgi:DNA-binding transcriptional LysR family regulator